MRKLVVVVVVVEAMLDLKWRSGSFGSNEEAGDVGNGREPHDFLFMKHCCPADGLPEANG
jgi:hypothetical protein